MQSRNRKLKRILSGQQNPKSNASKVGGIKAQLVVLKKGANSPSITEADWNEMSSDKQQAIVRDRNKVFTKQIVHQM